MWSEKRGLESNLIFAIFPIVLNVATNFVYFMRGGSYEAIGAINNVNSFTLFTIFICCILNFFEKSRNLSGEEKKEFNKKMYYMKLLGALFIGYILFTIIIVRNISIIISALLMFAGYINLYMFKSKIKSSYMLSETQRNWRKAYNKNSYEDINLLWKIKPMIHPHVSVSFIERIKHIDWIVLIFILPFSGKFRLEYIPAVVIAFIFIISDVLYFIDAIWGLYTDTKGICTGVVMKSGRRGRRNYYEVFVTDFENKRELKFRVYDYCNYNENDVLQLIHGGLSKKVIATKRVGNY